MDICKLKWTRLQAMLIRLFCIKAGQKLSLREIARRLKVSPTAVSNALYNLKKDDLIVITKSSTMNLLSIELNRSNHRAVQLKRVENLKLIYDSGLSDFLYEENPGCSIILFGSYSKGEDVSFGENDEKSSDIDIAIIGKAPKASELSKFEKMLERKILINYYPSWKDIHKHLKENILNGILLGGGVEL